MTALGAGAAGMLGTVAGISATVRAQDAKVRAFERASDAIDTMNAERRRTGPIFDRMARTSMRRSKMKDIVPFDHIVPRDQAAEARKIEASLRRFRAANETQMQAKRVADMARRVGRYGLIGGVVGGAALGALAGRAYAAPRASQWYDDHTQELERRWQSRIDRARAREAAQKSARPRDLRKAWGTALTAASLALPLLTETQTGQRAMRWAGKKISRGMTALASVKGASASAARQRRKDYRSIRSGLSRTGAAIDSQRATLASGAAAGGTYLLTRDHYRDRSA
jgi:hypothetical protein